MGEEDVAEVVEIERASSPAPWSAGLFVNEIRLAHARSLLAREATSGALAGFACFWIVAGEGQLLNLAVHPRRRRRGIGRRLVERVAAEARAAGAAVIGLEVREENRAARALYTCCGFRRVGARRDYYGRGRHAVLMDLDISHVQGDDRGSDAG